MAYNMAVADMSNEIDIVLYILFHFGCKQDLH